MTEARPTDEEILAYSQAVHDSATANVPLVSDALPMASLRAEYADASNSVFLVKINALCRVGDRGRYYKTRGDGNCFYRAFMTSLALQSSERPEMRSRLVDKIESVGPLLDRAGYSAIVYEDFMSTCLDLLRSSDDVLVQMNEPETSNGVVVFLRLVAAAFIKTNPDDYCPYLDLMAKTIETWVERSVEAMDAEADNVQIDALAAALDVSVDVVNLDGTEGEEANVHHVRPGSGIVVKVLYRPGHYDVLL